MNQEIFELSLDECEAVSGGSDAVAPPPTDDSRGGKYVMAGG